ncbi:MAG: hypothetical protein JO314_03345 [Acidobacteria bacterium]|nr:hypothetical protein [Acidobacteriota bacterium]
MLSPEMAALDFRMSERTIFRLIECGALHFVESDRIHVCAASLSELVRMAGENKFLEEEK